MSDLREDSPWGEVGRIVAERDALRVQVDRLRAAIGEHRQLATLAADVDRHPVARRDLLLWAVLGD